MNKLEVGEVVTLDNGEEYICFEKIEQEGTTYVFIMSNFTPLKINVAIEEEENGEIKLTYVKDQKKKEELLKLFAENHKND